jgi:hypothetical protein
VREVRAQVRHRGATEQSDRAARSDETATSVAQVSAVDHLPWLLSALTIWQTWLAGSMRRHAWLVGLGTQALWLWWILAAEAWGLLPLNAALWFTYARNHLRWRKL